MLACVANVLLRRALFRILAARNLLREALARVPPASLLHSRFSLRAARMRNKGFRTGTLVTQVKNEGFHHIQVVYYLHGENRFLTISANGKLKCTGVSSERM